MRVETASSASSTSTSLCPAVPQLTACQITEEGGAQTEKVTQVRQKSANKNLDSDKTNTTRAHIM